VPTLDFRKNTSVTPGISLMRALHSEVRKLKGTLALWLCLIAPLVVVALQTLQWLLQTNSPIKPNTLSAEIWQQFAGSALAIWAFLMLPLYVTLLSALLAGLEHQDRQWKHLLALPLPRASYYLAKLIALAGLLLLAMAILIFVLIPLAGQLLRLRGDIGISGLPDFAELSGKMLKIYGCAILLVALHTWIALRWKSFTIAVSIGMSATVMGFIIGQSKTFGPWFPWTMAMQPLTQNPDVARVLWVSVLSALVLTIAACWEFNRREFYE
jgi:lantibiotic transport system permease protein